MVTNATTKMYQEILEGLGLSPNEAKIYETLLGIGESSISEIATRSQIHRRNTYDAIKRLIDKGLVFELFSGAGNQYNAVEPDKLTELLAEKEQRLHAVLPELKKKFQGRQSQTGAYIYRGLEGQKNIMRDILRVNQPSYIVGAKGDWFDPRLEATNRAFFAEANRKKLKFNIIFDYEIKKTAMKFAKTWPGNLEYRFLPEVYSTNSLIHIFGDYVVTYSGLLLFKTPDNIVIFVLHSKDLAESYRKWFWYMWQLASGKK